MKTLIPALALGAVAVTVLAQDAQKAPQAPPKADLSRAPKIAVIDMQAVSSQSLLGKGYAAQLEGLRNEIQAEQTKKQNELSKLDAAIKAMQDDLEKQQSLLSPEALDKRRGEIVKKSRERQAFLEDGQQDLQRMQERAQQQAQNLNNEFQQKIKPHVEAVVKERGIDILLHSEAVVTNPNKDYDISQEVIVKADDAERAGRAKGAPAKPTPKPTPN
jgi:Skp family chaperone for outer membrane proteins